MRGAESVKKDDTISVIKKGNSGPLYRVNLTVKFFVPPSKKFFEFGQFWNIINKLAGKRTRIYYLSVIGKKVENFRRNKVPVSWDQNIDHIRPHCFLSAV